MTDRKSEKPKCKKCGSEDVKYEWKFFGEKTGENQCEACTPIHELATIHYPEK